MANPKPVLDVQNLTKRFGAKVLFEDISFSIAEGQRVGLIAQNGTGKSTLLAILMGCVWLAWCNRLTSTPRRLCLTLVLTIMATKKRCSRQSKSLHNSKLQTLISPWAN